MRVRMKTQYAGPGGSAGPGVTIDLEEAEANGLIAGGYAEAVPAAPELAPEPAAAPEAAPVPAIETATAPAPETAQSPRGRRSYAKR